MIAGDLERLIQLLARLPGLGPRSARRAVLHLMKKREALMLPLAEAMARAAETVTVCSTCGNLDTRDPCGICADPTQIGRAHVCTPVTNAHLVCRLLLEKNKTKLTY